MKKFPKNTVVLQPLQNSMIKVIYGLKKRIMLIWKISEKISRWCQSIKFQSTTHYWRLTISWDIHPLRKSTRNGLILMKRNISWELLQTMISKFHGSLSWNAWVLHTMEQSCLTYYHFKWGKTKTQTPSKLWQKIGYGTTSLHKY